MKERTYFRGRQADRLTSQGWTQKQVANLFGLSPARIQQLIVKYRRDAKYKGFALKALFRKLGEWHALGLRIKPEGENNGTVKKA